MWKYSSIQALDSFFSPYLLGTGKGGKCSEEGTYSWELCNLHKYLINILITLLNIYSTHTQKEQGILENI